MPDPEGPSNAVMLPLGMLELDAVEGAHGAAPHAIRVAHAAERNHPEDSKRGKKCYRTGPIPCGNGPGAEERLLAQG